MTKFLSQYHFLVSNSFGELLSSHSNAMWKTESSMVKSDELVAIPTHVIPNLKKSDSTQNSLAKSLSSAVDQRDRLPHSNAFQ